MRKEVMDDGKKAPEEHASVQDGRISPGVLAEDAPSV
jgi:hypothetical protein